MPQGFSLKFSVHLIVIVVIEYKTKDELVMVKTKSHI